MEGARGGRQRGKPWAKISRLLSLASVEVLPFSVERCGTSLYVCLVFVCFVLFVLGG